MRERLKQSYSETGRPSIDPELLLRILLIGYLYGITSERRLVEELRMHLAWRWFTGLGFDQEIPHHSTFSKNRHGRFQESKLFEQLFEQIVGHNAAKESRIPREQLGEASPGPSPPCASICGMWKSRTRWRSRCMNRIRSRPDRSRFHLCHQGRHARSSRILRQLSGG